MEQKERKDIGLSEEEEISLREGLFRAAEKHKPQGIPHMQYPNSLRGEFKQKKEE